MAKTLEQIQAELEALKTQFTDFSALSPVSYYTHQYSGEEIDDAITRALPDGAIDQAVGTFVRPNLLDNWYFGRPVNQRGQTEYTGERIYTIDRWYKEAGSTITIANDGVVFTPNPTTYNIFTQYVDNYEQFVEKELIFSLLVSENTCENCRLWVYGGNTDNFSGVDVGDPGLYSVSLTPKSNIISLRAGLQGRNTSGSIKILAAKLELGPTQTLAHQDSAGNWVLNEVPDYGEELARCQRYFVRLNSHAYGWTYNNSIVNCLIPLPVPLRTTPAITIMVNGTINTVEGDAAVTSYEVKGVTSNGLIIDLHNSANAFTSGTPVVWHNFDIAISAEL